MKNIGGHLLDIGPNKEFLNTEVVEYIRKQ